MPELIGVLARLNADDALEKLDDVLVDNCRFGMSANFCFRGGHESAVREGMIELAEAYYDRTGGRTNMISRDDRVRKLALREDIRQRLRDGDLAKRYFEDMETMSFYIRHMPKEALRSTETVYEYFTNVMWSTGAAARAGDSTLRYDGRILRDETDFVSFINFFLESCNKVKCYYACSGFSIIFYSYSTYSVDRSYPIFRRFPCFHYADTYAFSSDIKKKSESIPDINWLTAISDAMFERIGGTDAAKILDPDVVLHRYDGGVVFQAGPKPRIGDANMGDIPDAYRQVARFLRPLRFEDWDYPYLRVPDGVDKMQATRDWVSRFD